MPGRRYPLLFVFALLAGCDDKPTSPPESPRPRPDTGSRFDRATTGTVTGRVVWAGRRPTVALFRSVEYPLTNQPSPPMRDWPNPNAPVIDAEGGVGSAIVFLRGVDPARGRPWDHPPVRVELQNHAFRATGRFVRAGDEVEIISRQELYHSVQTRGADFTSLTLPEQGVARRRLFAKPGVVELLSGAGLFWMRGYLFVDHHPYYTTPDAQGTFRLSDVPEGEYDLVAWHADWRVQREERNSESFRVHQVRFRPPLEIVRRVRVARGKEVRIDLPLSAGD